MADRAGCAWPRHGNGAEIRPSLYSPSWSTVQLLTCLEWVPFSICMKFPFVPATFLHIIGLQKRVLGFGSYGMLTSFYWVAFRFIYVTGLGWIQVFN